VLGRPVWLFGVVLSLGVAVQEHVERFVAGGELPLDVVLEPTFAVGLLPSSRSRLPPASSPGRSRRSAR
jgi:hypothetical protein